MPALLPAIFTAAQKLIASPLVPVTDKPPSFNVEPTCRAAVTAYVTPGRDLASCLRDEQDARAKLERNWSGYSAKEQSGCLRLSLLDGQPSYVEVLTCLQIAEEAKKDAATTGPGGAR